MVSRQALPAAGLALLLLPGLLAAGCRKPPPDDVPAANAANAADAGANAADSGGDAEAAPTVSVTTVRRGVIEKTLAVTGTIQPLREGQASLGAPVPGVVDSLPVRTGQTVARGDVIAHLSTRLLEGQIAQARAAIAQSRIQVQQAQANALQQEGQTRSAIRQAQSATAGARATLAGAKATLIGTEAALAGARQTLARTQSLFGEGLVARKEVEAAQLGVRSAEAQVAAQRQAVAAQRDIVTGQTQTVAAARSARILDEVKRKDIEIAEQQLQSAKGALASLQAQLSLYTLRAPISGTVTGIGASLGETVDATTKLVTLANLDRVQLQMAIPAVSAASVRAGLPLRFTVDTLPGRAFRGAITSIGTQADPANNTITATALIDNPKHLLKSDLYARVRIVAGRHAGAALADRAALLHEVTADGTETSVLLLGKDSVLKKVVVKTGINDGNAVEIVGGVKPGDRVVTAGGYGLPDGTKVTVDTGPAGPAGDSGDSGDTGAAGEKP